MLKKEDPHANMLLSSKTNKEIMSLIRNGNYQHPGGEEAIDKTFSQIKKNSERIMLDVGAGRGGTANYLQKNGYGSVVGIDIDKEIVQIAKKIYGNLSIISKESPVFFHSNVLNINKDLNNFFKQKIQFDLIYSFSSFFLIADKKQALNSISCVSYPGAELIIFDYVDYGAYLKNPYKENGKNFLPNIMRYAEIKEIFTDTEWKINSIVNIDKEFIHWYTTLILKIDSYKTICCSKYGEESFLIFRNRYAHILNVLLNKILGGVIIYASKI